MLLTDRKTWFWLYSIGLYFQTTHWFSVLKFPATRHSERNAQSILSRHDPRQHGNLCVDGVGVAVDCHCQ